MKKRFLLVSSVLTSAAYGQVTPPIQPNLTPVPLPPAVTLPAPAQLEVTAPLSADEAAQIALKKSPSLEITRALLLAAQGRANEAAATLLPSLALSTGYSRVSTVVDHSTSKSSGSSSTGYSSTASLRQLLFDFNHTRDIARQANALRRAQLQNYTRAQADLVLQVKTLYYTFAQNQRLVVVQEANLAASQAQLALAQARLNESLGAPADVVTAQTNVAAASQSVAQARQTALSSRISLALAMGIDPRTPLSPSNTEEADVTEGLDPLVNRALTQRPEIAQAKEAVRAAQFGVSAAKSVNAPSLGLNLSYGSKGPDDPTTTQTASYGVTLTWNFYDSGVTAARVQQAGADVVSAQGNLTLTTQTVVSDVAQAYASLHASTQRLDIARSQVANAQERMRLAEGRFRGGVATFLEVSDAQAALVSAQASEVNAAIAVQLARATLRRATGERLPTAVQPAQ